MSRLTLALLAAALLIPGTAQAATFGQAPPSTVEGPRSECLQATGTPGELFSLSRDGVQLLGADRSGIAKGQRFDFDVSWTDCPAAATNASGAGVVVCCVGRRPPAGVFRDPGGTWSEPAELGPEEGHLLSDLAVAVSARGDAIVVWAEQTAGRDTSVKAIRRAPGGSFGAIETLGTTRDQMNPDARARSLDVGIAGDGEAFVLWTTPRTDRSRSDVTVATAMSGSAFAPAVRLADVSRHEHPSLAVASDGHALVAFGDGTSVQVAERAPGGTFGAPVRVAALADPLAAHAEAELGADGRALVAWSGVATGGVHLVTRAAGEGFSAATTLAPGDPKMYGDVFLNEQFGGFGHWDFGGTELSSALGPDGRAAVAWADQRRRPRSANLTVASFDGGAPVTHTLGGRLTGAGDPRPVFLADGTPALTYVDRVTREGFQVRLAADGASSPEPKLPRIRVRRPASATLAGPGAELRVPVECSGPCELRARLSGTLSDETGLALRKGGKGTLVFRDFSDAVDRNRRGRVRVRVTYGAPDGSRTRTTETSFEVRRTGLHPGKLRRVVGLRAVRHGTSIRATWRLSSRIVGGMLAQVVGRATRSPFEDPLSYADNADGGRSFSVTLQHATKVEYVSLYHYLAVPTTSVVTVR